TNRAGEDRELVRYCLKDGSVSETVIKEKSGMIKNRFLPTDIGQVVNEFLEEYFNDIVDYNFTAQVEREFDDIAEGKKSWNEMIKEFYAPFKIKVLQTLEDAKKFSGERLLGKDPETGLNIYAKIGRYGLIVQKGESKSDVKPEFASLQENQTLQGINLEEALDLFKFPRDLGKFEDSVLTVARGRFGPYIKHKGKFISIDKDDPARISRERAIELVLEKRKSDQEKIIRQFDQEPELKILKGRWGPYIAFKGKNYKIPKQNDPENLTLEECLEIIKNTPVKSNTGRNRRFGKR
ncbi:MAG: DNA topoisomerase I, partial [Candidatus Cloacimonetes bacterium]|nr:DNA topoisomerase I [Candidatus Cloacimonadota bacterium]